MKPTYESPLASRYASKTMLHLFSPDMRYETWRRLWVALARAEHTLGLPVTQQQVDELAAHVSPIDYDAVAKREKEVRHDVMAHIYAYGLDAPGAKGIIHLGATSCYVTDNADLIIYREALRYLEKELKAAMRNLCDFADRYAAMPALAYTHYQPAQLTTIGKRASLWLQDLLLDLEELQDTLRAFRFLGCRGTTGTEASFMELLGARISAQKARLVADQIRGKKVGEALNLLTFSSKKAAEIIKKVLESAIANAEHNEGADVDDLTVSTVFVNEGRSLKRIMPRAKGRADRIVKRSCHITVKVADK